MLLVWPVSKRIWDGANVMLAAEPLPLSGPDSASAAPKGGPNLNPGNVEGDSLCIDCHRAEFVHLWSQWRDSVHGWKGYSLLLGDEAKKYGDGLGIDATQLTKESVCIECHATPSLDFHGRTRPIVGVACEACHNASGGENGWLNMHAAYGPPGTQRVSESEEHFRDRKQESQKRGQLQSSNIYDLARRCYDCHIVGDEALITKTDHPIGEKLDSPNFVRELTDEKIRHNFHLDQSVNAPVSSLWTDSHWHPERAANLEQSVTNRKKMYHVIGVLARAETILRLSARVGDPAEKYAGELGNLLDPGDIEDVLEKVELSDAERDDVGNIIKTLEDMDLEGTAGDIDENGKLSADERRAILSVADRIKDLGTRLAAGGGDNLVDVELP